MEIKKPRQSFWWIVGAMWLVFALQNVYTMVAGAKTVAYSDFKVAVAAGKVERVAVSPSAIRGQWKEGQAPNPKIRDFDVVRVEDKDLLPDLTARGVKVDGVADSTWYRDVLSWVLPLGLFFAFSTYLSRRMGGGGRGGFMAIGESKAKVYMEKDVKVSFADVAGLEEAKEELKEVVDFLKTPERFARLGGRIPKGILLAGPPGTGKTLLARAVAGEAGVPFFSISGSEFVEMFVGVGAARVRDLFVQARTKAPCIVFIDELDALGKVRGAGPMAHEEREQTLNQLLVELDGFDPRLGVILMAATNRPEILDPALLRAGRFDRHVLVDRPDKAGRLAILTLHAKAVALAPGADLATIASMTAGFVGADLANIINEAALLAVRRGRENVGSSELQEAVERVIAGLERRNRVLTPADKQRVARHEVGHALVSYALPGVDVVQKISIIPRGIAALGYTLQLPTEDRFLMTQGELQNKIATLLGGRVAEELCYGEVSTGAQDDLVKATSIARSMVKAYGMSRELGPVSFDSERSPFMPTAPGSEPRGDYSESTAQRIDAEVRGILDAEHERVRGILSARRPALEAAALELLSREVLSGDELRVIVDRHALLAATG